jgi:hypothetical protein
MTEPLEPTYDAETLREVYADPEALRARITALRQDIRTAPDDVAELLARGELVVLLRGLGELDDALAEGRRAADRADMVGTAPQQHLARLRLAHVHQWRGEFAESTMLFTELLNGVGQFGPVIEAFTREQVGKNAYEQGLYSDAEVQFAFALTLRESFELPEEQIESSRLALAAARRHLKESTGGSAS